MNIKHRIIVACSIAGITQTELAAKLNMSPSSLSRRLITGKFTDEELRQMAAAIGAEYKSFFIFPTGEKVE